MSYMYQKLRYSYIERVAPQRILTNQSEKIIFTRPMLHSEKFAKSIAFVGPSLWNDLTSEEMFIQDHLSLKKAVKNRLFISEQAQYANNGASQ